MVHLLQPRWTKRNPQVMVWVCGSIRVEGSVAGSRGRSSESLTTTR
jgi:hypothetical protein